MSLRIIGGRHRRRQLRIPQGVATRPYTDRVRQLVFDRIVDIIPDARVADIYSGVGTMGLESISRGATSCVFIESTPVIHRTLKENVQRLAVDSRTVCWKTDVRYTSFVPKGCEGMVPYTLLFFDPPYADCHKLEPGGVLSKSLARLSRPNVSAAEALLLLRTPRLFKLTVPAGWQLQDCWQVSSMNVWNLIKPARSAPGHADDERTVADSC